MPKISELGHLGKAVRQSLARGAPDIDLDTLPQSLDLSPDKITENVLSINSQTPDDRQRFVNEALVKHMHDFVREVSLTTNEWMNAIEYLTRVGQTCTDLRQEFILLSDVFGVSALVDIINNPKPEGATEGTVLGPFFVEDAKIIDNGESIANEGRGEYMLVKGRILDLSGRPVANCAIETWETDQDGFYDTQYTDYNADCRGKLYSDQEGYYVFRAVLPVSYPIPNDGPVGQLLASMNRHVFRPAHLHMMFQAPGFAQLITSLYFTGDTFLTSDAVFGVKSSLIVEPRLITEEAEATKCGFKNPPFYLVEKDFVLVSEQEAEEARERVRTQGP
ncbi:uncharacterized protein I303_106937 [Kwoniella dejecticola CBS 10117]|uniref:Intradiol ring-cleavage dioxygenases domain-containing protein n=1 Tax=Kwoniella dejecticola CBS 10117 TaxID=1296121 RepID=A0A1A5ZTA1_9TREE|nr:uncharacterized protein I303_08424 [Kwoniella dejecticola CBS 10117]OBR81042.1 hypothetical protein I303_08424 [Kwoniella dejecticola CBS 10117]